MLKNSPLFLHHRIIIISVVLKDYIISLVIYLGKFTQTSIIISMTTEQNLNLFTILERGDRKIKSMGKRIIGLCGLTRAGKSCSFNWISRRSMIGTGDQIDSNYINSIQNEVGIASQSDELKSNTLIPNTTPIDENIDLVDFAGYFDTRNYKGVIGVSYFLQSVFEHVEEVKFIIVFNEHSFTETTGASIIKTLQGFINMFDEKVFANPAIKEKLFDSVAMLVTKTKQAHLHTAYMIRLSKKLKEPNLKFDKKDILIELVDAMVKSNRKSYFEAAIDNKHPPQCQILDEFNGLGWKFFNLREAKEIHSNDIIRIPFDAQFKALSNDERDVAEQEVKDKIDNCVRFNQIIKDYMTSLKNNWDTAIREEKPFTLMSLKKVLDFRSVFDKIDSFLNVCDHYNTIEHIKISEGSEYAPPNMVESLQNVMKIYELAEKSDQISNFGPFQEIMTQFRDFFINLIDLLRSLCIDRQEQILVHRLKFVMNRSFDEFIQFSKMDESKFSYSKNTIKDQCNTAIGNIMKHEYLQSFMDSMNTSLLLVLFKNIKELNQFEELFTFYKDVYKFSDDPDKQAEQRFNFSQREVDICFVKADMLLENGQKVKAAEQFVIILQSMIAQGIFIESLSLTYDEISLKQNQLMMGKLKVCKKILIILSSLNIKNYTQARSLAISLATHIEDAHLTVNLYKIMVKEEDVPEKQAEILQNYADFCIEYGRFEEAKTVLQHKLSISDYDYDAYRQTEDSLIDLAEKLAVKEMDYMNKINKMNRLPASDQTLSNLLNEIKEELAKKPVDISKISNPETSGETSPNSKEKYNSKRSNNVLGELYN